MQARRFALYALQTAASSAKCAQTFGRHVELRSFGVATKAVTSSSLLRANAPTNSVRGFASDTHDDFKPKTNATGAEDVAKIIDGDVKSNNVIIYMKGSPAAPQCGFSNMACRILDHHSVEYASRNVLASDELRNGIKEYSSWPTIPQLYVKGEFVGGSDIMMSMHQSGELQELFQDLPKRQ